MDEIRIEIPLDPVTKKNSLRVVRAGQHIRVIPSEAFVRYQNACAEYLLPIKQDAPIHDRVSVKCLFYRRTKRRIDLTNLLESIDDVLVHYGILSDDSHTVIASHDGSRVLLDRDRPRTEITISPMED